MEPIDIFILIVVIVAVGAILGVAIWKKATGRSSGCGCGCGSCSGCSSASKCDGSCTPPKKEEKGNEEEHACPHCKGKENENA